ncbi:MAG: ATP-binding protein [Chloroflexota bacterium]
MQEVYILLKNCPRLKILATGREALGIMGEVVYRVPSLELPDSQDRPENIKMYESVRLFEERAQLAQADFMVTPENASFVAQICSRLDGIPLAIELAAARVDMFSMEQIAAHLNESFNMLTGKNRTALPRQQTIRASIDWSWNLISNPERTFLRRLAVFAGGWILEAAESICSRDNIAPHQVLELTAQLAAKSLVIVGQKSGSERRFHLHETIRQYAHEKLVEAGEEENIRSLHLKYFLDLSKLDEPVLHGHQQVEWFNRINDELGNIRIALEHASRTDLEMGLYLTGGLIRYWSNFDLREGLFWTTEFIQKPESQNYPHARAKALLAQGEILWYLQQFEEGRSVAEECISLFRACNDKQGEFESLMLMGSVLQFLEGMKEKTNFHGQGLELAKSMGDIWRQARAFASLGWDQRDPKQAQANWEQAITLFREVGDWRNLTHTLGILGFTVLSNGNAESAQKFLDEAMDANQHANDKWSMEFVLTGKGYLALMRGEYEQARAFLQENADFLEEVGNRMGYLWACGRLGYVALREGNVTEAYSILVEIIENFQKDRNKSGLAFALDRMASIFCAANNPESAVRLVGSSDTIRKEIGDPRPRFEQNDINNDMKAIRTKIGKAAFEKHYSEGCAMTLDDAVTQAMEKIRL